MDEHAPGYVAGLTTQLCERPDLLRIAEDELQELRGSMRKISGFLNNPTIPLDIRQGLARDLQLPTPDR
jgi:hypothetical protein